MKAQYTFCMLGVLLTFMFVMGLAHADVIPVCPDLRKAPEKNISSVTDLVIKAEEYSRKGKHCKSARQFQLALVKNQTLAIESGIDLEMLRVLSRGGYLNDFTVLSLELKKLKPNHPRMDEMDYLNLIAYKNAMPKDPESNPRGNFTGSDGFPVPMMEEMFMALDNFREVYGSSNHDAAVSAIEKGAHEAEIIRATKKFQTDYKIAKKNNDTKLLNMLAGDLAKKINRHGNSESTPEALYRLGEMFYDQRKLDSNYVKRFGKILKVMRTEFPSHKRTKKLGKKAKKVNIKNLNNLDLNLLTAELIGADDLNRERLSNDELKAIIKMKKGNDRTMFLPVKFSKSEKVAALAGLGLAGFLFAFDRPIKEWIQDNARSDGMDAFIDVTNDFGDETYLGPLIGGSLAIGLVFKNDKLKQAAVRSLGSAVMAGLTIEIMKALSHRQRPRDSETPYDFQGADWQSDNTSFPSGHSGGAWSVLTVFATEFKDTKIVPIVAYGLAALTSYSRVHKNAHWASDVTLGAVIGFVSGKIASKVFRKRPTEQNTFTISPSMGDVSGASMIIRSKTQLALQSYPLDYFAYVNLQTKNCKEDNSCQTIRNLIK